MSSILPPLPYLSFFLDHICHMNYLLSKFMKMKFKEKIVVVVDLIFLILFLSTYHAEDFIAHLLKAYSFLLNFQFKLSTKLPIFFGSTF